MYPLRSEFEIPSTLDRVAGRVLLGQLFQIRAKNSVRTQDLHTRVADELGWSSEFLFEFPRSAGRPGVHSDCLPEACRDDKRAAPTASRQAELHQRLPGVRYMSSQSHVEFQSSFRDAAAGRAESRPHFGNRAEGTAL